jgi:hypothetical protein
VQFYLSFLIPESIKATLFHWLFELIVVQLSDGEFVVVLSHRVLLSSLLIPGVHFIPLVWGGIHQSAVRKEPLLHCFNHSRSSFRVTWRLSLSLKRKTFLSVICIQNFPPSNACILCLLSHASSQLQLITIFVQFIPVLIPFL